MAEFTVEVVKNGVDSQSERQQITLKKGMTFLKFKKECAKKLNMKVVKNVYLETGAEIQNTDEISANSVLYISQGEPFFRNPDSGPKKDIYSISVLGSAGVGKSALTLRFVKDFFATDWDPTIEDAYRKPYEVDGKSCILEILDTAGQDEFTSLRSQWMADKDGYVFVYAMNEPSSLDELQPFFDLHEQLNHGKSFPVILAANKKDIVEDDPKRLTSIREKGMAKAVAIGATYMETSAQSGERVNDIFETLVRQVRKDKVITPKKPSNCVIS